MRLYLAKNHTYIDEEGNRVDNDKGTKAMKKRAEKIVGKGKELDNKKNLERIEKKGRKYANKCIVTAENEKKKKKERHNKRKSRNTIFHIKVLTKHNMLLFQLLLQRL